MSRLPAVRDGMLYTSSPEAPIRVGSPQWFAWLDAARSFTFAGAEGTFTARHEERSGRRFWYAYRQRNKSLRKSYLGRSPDLTPPRLAQAARDLEGTGATAVPAHPPGEWASPLIATKIAPPQPGQSLVTRSAVVARCLASIEHTCTILAAPAGFGKTTLLMMACEQLSTRGWQIAWVSLEETERDPVRFWSYALAALDSVRPGVSAGARRMLETPRTPPIENVLTPLINALAAATTPLVLVLDDYHRAATPDRDAGLAFLVEHAPATLHLVISTRADPALPLAGLRAGGRIAELHAADLRFSTDEAGRFLRETMRVALPDDAVRLLDERTEGWVAGLQLAALSLRDQPHTDGMPDLIADRTATPRYIAEFLIDEVLEHQPEEVQAFLLQTSPLERLTGPLCDAVTGRTDSAAMLARLMHAQLFVTPLDAAHTWYRYHQLFAEVLRERLERTAPDLLARCHRRAAEWLRQQGMRGEAIRHLLAARAFDEAAALIEGESDRLILRGETAGLVGWVRDLPREAILSHPHLCVLFAAGLFLQGNGPEAVTWLDTLERHMVEMGSRSAEIAGEIGVVRGILLLIGGDFTGGAALAAEAIKQLRPDDQLLRGLALWITNIVGVLGDDDLFDSTSALARIAEESLQAGNILVAFMALITVAGIEMFQGRLHRAAQSSRRALRLAPPVGGQELPITAMAYCLLGEIERERNDLESAEGDLRHALAVAATLSSGEFINDGVVSLAMVQAARGHYAEALAT
ncbi:MAG: tetratricopeptide repeat protein, partial [Ktedonobacterales bacterium]